MILIYLNNIFAVIGNIIPSQNITTQVKHVVLWRR